MTALQVTQEEADRWFAHLKNCKLCSYHRTSPEKRKRIAELLQAGESKNQITKNVHVGSATVDSIERELASEGLL